MRPDSAHLRLKYGLTVLDNEKASAMVYQILTSLLGGLRAGRVP